MWGIQRCPQVIVRMAFVALGVVLLSQDRVKAAMEMIGTQAGSSSVGKSSTPPSSTSGLVGSGGYSVGTACNKNSNCLSGMCVWNRYGSDPNHGTCGTAALLRGDVCTADPSNSYTMCGSGRECVAGSNLMVCKNALGSSCANNTDCDVGGANRVCNAGVCDFSSSVTPAGLNETCYATGGMAQRPCSRGVCDATSNKCKLAIGTSGCTDDIECAGGHCNDLGAGIKTCGDHQIKMAGEACSFHAECNASAGHKCMQMGRPQNLTTTCRDPRVVKSNLLEVCGASGSTTVDRPSCQTSPVSFYCGVQQSGGVGQSVCINLNGTSCSADNECESGLCAGPTGAKVCVSAHDRAEGQACFDSRQCTGTLECAIAGGNQKVCINMQAGSSDGQACFYDSQCSSRLCVAASGGGKVCGSSGLSYGQSAAENRQCTSGVRMASGSCGCTSALGCVGASGTGAKYCVQRECFTCRSNSDCEASKYCSLTGASPREGNYQYGFCQTGSRTSSSVGSGGGGSAPTPTGGTVSTRSSSSNSSSTGSGGGTRSAPTNSGGSTSTDPGCHTSYCNGGCCPDSAPHCIVDRLGTGRYYCQP